MSPIARGGSPVATPLGAPTSCITRGRASSPAVYVDRVTGTSFDNPFDLVNTYLMRYGERVDVPCVRLDGTGYAQVMALPTLLMCGLILLLNQLLLKPEAPLRASTDFARTKLAAMGSVNQIFFHPLRRSAHRIRRLDRSFP